MRLALAITLLASPLCAQVPGPGLPYYAGGGPLSVTPGSLGARYWWVSSDNALNVKIGQWADRVQGVVLSNSVSASTPTNSSGGVGFSGTTFLTNQVTPTIFIGTPGASSPTGSVWIVFSPQTPPGTTGGIMTGVDGHGLFEFTSGNTLQFFGNSGSGTICAFTPGNTYDMAIIKTNSNADLLFYTNGVSRIAFAAGDFATGGFTELGTDTESGGPFLYKGKVLEVAFFYSNIPPSIVTSLHTYATNTYGFSP